MKNIISILLLFYFLIALATEPVQFRTGRGCRGNVGHVYYAPDSIWSDSCGWYVKAECYRIDEVNKGDDDTFHYNEYMILPAGCDTTYFKCLRCDSVGYYVSDTVKYL